MQEDMAPLVLSVVMLSSGIALASRAIHASPGGPTAGFFVALIVCGVGVFMLVRALLARRAAGHGVSTLTMTEAMERWRTKDLERLFDPPARRWGAAGDEAGSSAGGSELRAAARALLLACDAEPPKATRSRRALRSACRRIHFRGVVPAPQPQRRRVRPRPRLCT